MSMFDDLIPGKQTPSSRPQSQPKTGMFNDLVPSEEETEQQSGASNTPTETPVSVPKTEQTSPQSEPVQTPQGVPYDAAGIDAELQRGVSPEQVVDSLLQQGGRRVQLNDQVFDVAAARAAGVNDQEIARILVTGEGWEQLPDGIVGQVDALGRGVNTGITRLVGAPVDLMNNAPRVANLIPGVDGVGPISEYPIGGSDSLQDGLEFLGVQTYDDVSELPPRVRPAARSGEVIGESIPLVGGAGIAARAARPATATSGTTRRVADTVLNPMRTNPNLAYGTEAISTLGAAQGAFWGQILAPDNPTIQMGLEVLGGFANPVSIATRQGRRAFQGVNRFARTYLGDNQQVAADVLTRAIRESGEDPEELIGILDEAARNPVEDLDLTAGQATGSRSLLALENALAQKSQDFLGYRQDRIAASFETLRRSADALAASGNPDAVRAAARLRQKYFRDLVNSRLAVAQTEAAEAARRFQDADPAMASSRVREIQDQALTDVRAIESSLWEQIPRNTEVSTEGTVGAYERLRDSLLEEEGVPGLAESFVRRISGEAQEEGVEEVLEGGATATAGDMLRFRSRMLALGRDAAARGENDLARQFNTMADGALEDLNSIDMPEAADAREFSRQLNQVFRTSNLERLGAQTRTGADAVRPEETLDSAFGGGRQRGQLNLEEMDQAARFADDANANIAGRESNLAGETQANIETFLRNKVDELADPTTGEIDQRRLDRFLRDNQQLVDQYPNLRDDIVAASEASRAAKEAAENSRTAEQAINNRAVFSRVVQDEDPSRVVGQVMEGGRPDAEYSQLARLAQRNGPEAVEGLKTSTMDYAFRTATNADGSFSFGRFRNQLLAPQNARGQSMVERMVSNGVMSQDEANRLVQIVDEMDRLAGVAAENARLAGEVVDPESGPVFDFAQRIAGSAVGQASLVGQASGASLVAAGAGVRLSKSIMDRIPRARLTETLIEVSKDPQATADLLRRSRSPAERIARDQRLNAFLIQQGIINPDEDPVQYPSSVEQEEEDGGPVRIQIRDSAGTMSEEETERMLRENEAQQ